MDYIVSLSEFYENLRDVSSEEVSEMIKYFKKSPVSAFFIENDFEKPYDEKKRIFYEDNDDICLNLERIVKSNYARENNFAFEDLEDIPSSDGHEHSFLKIGEFSFNIPNNKYNLDFYSDIYECEDEECRLQVYECPRCGYVPCEDLTGLIIRLIIQKESNNFYCCSNCDTALGDKFLFTG
jgi:hypothetical protein